MDRCIGLKELRTIIPVSRPTIDRWEQLPVGDDPFPRRIQIGKCRVCWMLSAVMGWLERRANR